MFTPNNDGQNDNFLIYGYGLDEEIAFKIFNRWGNVVYETNSLNEMQTTGWDGKENDIEQPSGVYFWTIVSSDLNGNPVNFSPSSCTPCPESNSGSILLKR